MTWSSDKRTLFVGIQRPDAPFPDGEGKLPQLDRRRRPSVTTMPHDRLIGHCRSTWSAGQPGAPRIFPRGP